MQARTGRQEPPGPLARWTELQAVYDSLDRDLIEARKLQQTLVRDRYQDFGRGTVSLLLRPSGHVGGDLVGGFRINARRIAIYAVDVSGHGVASAMMTARLAGMLSGVVAGPEPRPDARAWRCSAMPGRPRWSPTGSTA